jgi:hypothetical protein
MSICVAMILQGLIGLTATVLGGQAPVAALHVLGAIGGGAGLAASAWRALFERSTRRVP